MALSGATKGRGRWSTTWPAAHAPLGSLMPVSLEPSPTNDCAVTVAVLTVVAVICLALIAFPFKSRSPSDFSAETATQPEHDIASAMALRRA